MGKSVWKKIWKYRHIFATAFAVTVMSALYYFPFDTYFRISPSVAILAFVLLYFSNLPVLATAIISGMMILATRVTLDVFGGKLLLAQAFFKHFPALIFYVIFGLILSGFRIRSHLDRPFILIPLLTVADMLANLVELAVRGDLNFYTVEQAFPVVLGVGFSRAVLALLLYWAMKRYKMFIIQEEHQNRYIELNMLIANLKAEIFYLKKSMQDIEEVMEKSYYLYDGLKEQTTLTGAVVEEIKARALTIAKDIHEVKKDYQRVVSGFEKLVSSQEPGDEVRLADIFFIIEQNTRRYLDTVGKLITVSFSYQENFLTKHYFALVSIINNLLINAIEACDADGVITVTQESGPDRVVLRVADNGEGIPGKRLQVIFKPGFSTKYNREDGKMSTGLGLTHVKHLTESLGGTIAVESVLNKGTVFTVAFPRYNIVTKEDDGQ